MGMKKRVVLAMCIGLWTANIAAAADWSIVPSVTQRSEFNSNLNISYTNPQSDYIFSLQPAVEFNYTTEISQLQGRLGLFGQHYLTNSNLDHIDQNYQINGQYRIAPRINLTLKSTYFTDTTLLQELETSGLVIGRTPRQSFRLGPGVTFNLTERLLSTVSYDFNRVLYQDSRFIDYTSHQAGLNFTYLMKDEKTSLINYNIIRETLYPGGNYYKSLGIYLGMTRKFTERWEGSLMSGANISFFSFDTQVLSSSQFPDFTLIKTKRNDSSSVTPYVNISTSYRWTNLSLAGGFSRDLSAGANGAVYEFNRLYLNCSYNISERLTASLTGSYSLSNQASQDITSRYNYYTFSPQLTYKITEKLSFSPGYSYSGAENLSTTGGSGHVHQAWLQFAYTYPIHFQR